MNMSEKPYLNILEESFPFININQGRTNAHFRKFTVINGINSGNAHPFLLLRHESKARNSANFRSKS